MALRFQKRIKIAPGLRLNFGLRGASLSVGPRGASVTVGKSGVYGNLGAPGTGFSIRKKLSGTNSGYDNTSNNTNLSSEKVNIAMSLSDNGSINFERESGEPLSRNELKLLWKQQGETITQWLEEEVDGFNGDVDFLINIHINTPPPNQKKDYKIKPLSIPKPKKPDNLPSLSFIKSLFKSNRIEHEKAQQNLHTEYVRQLEKWNKEKQEHDKLERKKKVYFKENISKDIKLMDESLQEAFNSLKWPRETLISYDISESGKIVFLDVDLPEIEDFPQKVATIAASGRKLNIKNKAQKTLREEYAKHVHGIIFKIVGIVFATLPSPFSVNISGYTQRLDKTTGKINDDYIFSFKVDRGKFSDIDFQSLERVDPIESLASFEHRRKMTATGIFKVIEPFNN